MTARIEVPKERPTGKVINLMDALRRSVQADGNGRTTPASGKKGRKKIEGQKEMLLPIAGKKAAREEQHGRTQRTPAKHHRKAG